jgi:hypothetical protein
MITKTDAIAELCSLQEDLAKYGRCMVDGCCTYVQEGHPGCAIGRRMDEDEKAYIMEQDDHVNECTSVIALDSEGCFPKYFENWNMGLLTILQSIHDSYNPESPTYIGWVRKYFMYVEEQDLTRQPEDDHDNR